MEEVPEVLPSNNQGDNNNKIKPSFQTFYIQLKLFVYLI